MATLLNVPFKTRAFQDSFYLDTRFPGVRFNFVQQNGWVPAGTDWRSGTKNPDWKHQVARKQDATTAYESTRFHARPAIFHGQTVFKNLAPEYTVSGFDELHQCAGDTLVNMNDDTTLRDLALARIKRRLSSNIGGMATLVPVAELREMRGLIRNTSDLATSAVRSLIDIRRTRGRSAYSWAADAWLNFNFGVRPLIADTENAIQAVGSYLTRQDLNASISGTARKTWQSSVSLNTVTGAIRGPVRITATASHTLSYRYAAGLSIALKSGNNYGITEHLGLELSSLPSVAWELFPYSWVFDYFTTVGAYLDDTFVIPPGSTKFLYLNKRYTMKAVVRGNHYPYNIGSTPPEFCRVVLDTCAPGFFDCDHFKREKLSSLPRLSLRFRTVDEVAQGAVNRLLNLASLLASGGRRPRS